MSKVNKSEKIPNQMQSTFDAIGVLTDRFCKENLNDEYAQLAHEATAALCRKRPSPIAKGHTAGWACGIIYALGFVNFLFDKSHEPYMSAADLCKAFGISQSTGSAKSRVVRDALDMMQMDPNWCLPSMENDNPLVWMLTVNGLTVDVREMPREIQEVAYHKGLIPYIPDDRIE